MENQETITPVMIDYTVVKGPIANAAREIFQIGETVQYEENDPIAAGMVAAGLIMLKSEQVTKPEVVEEETTAPVPVVTTEEKLSYRGHVILKETERVVGAQAFHHIHTDEGHEYDLTEEEYKTEVKI